MRALIAVPAIAIVAAGVAYQASGTTYATLGESLHAKGYTSVLSYPRESPNTLVRTEFHPEVTLDWTLYGSSGNPDAWDAAYFGRYGVHSSNRYGGPSKWKVCPKEPVIDETLLRKVVRHESNPLSIDGNFRWEADRTDLEDLTCLSSSAVCGHSAWEEYIYPVACSLGLATWGCEATPPPPTPTPTPEPPPVPTPTPIPPPPTPTPEPPLPSQWEVPSWSVQRIHCGEGVNAGTLCLELRFKPTHLSTGVLDISITETQRP